jgi:hypothetical protein
VAFAYAGTAVPAISRANTVRAAESDRLEGMAASLSTVAADLASSRKVQRNARGLVSR